MNRTMLLKCLLLLSFPLVAVSEDGLPVLDSPLPVLTSLEPQLVDSALPVLISEPPCCDPLVRPDGQNGNPICFEGSACCPDGTWSCSIGDGQTFPCGGVNVQNPQGTICTAGPTKPPRPTSAPTRWKYMVPEWWDLVADNFEGNLQRCRKRQFPPAPNTKCGREAKTCFFGNKNCEGVGALPEVRCDCVDKKWTCSDAMCPESSIGTTTGNSCPLVIDNPPDCPIDNPLVSPGALCTASLVGETCNYGEESCCGNCFPNFFCHCFSQGEGFGCGFTDACLIAPCLQPEQEAAWAALVGTKCDPDAKNAILADYPGMNVVCIEEGSIVTADFRTDRVRLFFDPATGLVTQPPRVG